MGLKDDLLRGIYSYGFEAPSLIQSKAIVPVIEGREIIAQSQSGTGKTGTFVISMLQRIDEKIEKCQAVVMSTTHELASQTHSVISSIGSYMKIKVALLIGGTNVRESIDEMNEDIKDNKKLIGIGERCYINNAIVDKNCRIGNDVYINGGKHLENVSNELYSIKDGIVVIKKGAVIPDNFVIK